MTPTPKTCTFCSSKINTDKLEKLKSNQLFSGPFVLYLLKTFGVVDANAQIIVNTSVNASDTRIACPLCHNCLDLLTELKLFKEELERLKIKIAYQVETITEKISNASKKASVDFGADLCCNKVQDGIVLKRNCIVHIVREKCCKKDKQISNKLLENGDRTENPLQFLSTMAPSPLTPTITSVSGAVVTTVERKRKRKDDTMQQNNNLNPLISPRPSQSVNNAVLVPEFQKGSQCGSIQSKKLRVSSVSDHFGKIKPNSVPTLASSLYGLNKTLTASMLISNIKKANSNSETTRTDATINSRNTKPSILQTTRNRRKQIHSELTPISRNPSFNVSFPNSVNNTRNVSELKGFDCEECGRVFETKPDVNRHLKVYHRKTVSKKKVSCESEFCKANPNKYSKLQYIAHLHKEHETEQKNFFCSKCNKGFTLQTIYERHLQFHASDNSNLIPTILSCDDCGMEFHNFTDSAASKSLNYHKLSNHKKYYKAKEKQTCPTCKRQFVGKNHLVRHITDNHEELLKYICYCGKQYPEENLLNTHQNTHSSQGPYKCTICNQSYVSANSLVDHFKRHTGENRIKCPDCSEFFEHSLKLLQHAFEIHGKDKEHVCNICSRKYHSAMQLEKHQRRTHGPKNVSCEYCDKKVADEYSLRAHVRARHSTTTKTFKCEICEAILKTKDGLIGHVNAHKGIKNYLCTYCGKSFVRSVSLTLHLRIHTGEKPYQCKVCNRAWTQKHCLLKHMKRAHEGKESKHSNRNTNDDSDEEEEYGSESDESSEEEQETDDIKTEIKEEVTSEESDNEEFLDVENSGEENNEDTDEEKQNEAGNAVVVKNEDLLHPVDKFENECSEPEETEQIDDKYEIEYKTYLSL